MKLGDHRVAFNDTTLQTMTMPSTRMTNLHRALLQVDDDFQLLHQIRKSLYRAAQDVTRYTFDRQQCVLQIPRITPGKRHSIRHNFYQTYGRLRGAICFLKMRKQLRPLQIATRLAGASSTDRLHTEVHKVATIGPKRFFEFHVENYEFYHCARHITWVN